MMGKPAAGMPQSEQGRFILSNAGDLTSLHRKRLSQLRDAAAAIRAVRFSSVMLETDCAHGCAHCVLSAPAPGAGQRMSRDTLEEARMRGFLHHSLSFIGGEPLDFPGIGKLIWSHNGHIPSTNGFSQRTHTRRIEQLRTLGRIGPRIQSVSFHTFDRWKGGNPGRDEAILHNILSSSRPEATILCRLGEEGKLLRAWLRMVLRLLESRRLDMCLAREMRDPTRFPKVHHFLAGMPHLGQGDFTVLVPARLGRARSMEGLVRPHVPDYLFLADEGTVSDAILWPGGGILSDFLYCNYGVLDGAAGSLGDDQAKTAKELRSLVVGFLDRLLGLGDGEWRLNLREIIINHERSIRSNIAISMDHDDEPDIAQLLCALRERFRELRLAWRERPSGLADRSAYIERTADEHWKRFYLSRLLRDGLPR